MKFFKKTDLIILAAILVAGIGGWFAYHQFYDGRAAAAQIYYKTQLVQTIDLSQGEDRRFSIDQNKNVVFHVFPDGSICFEESDCRDKICIHTGRLHTAGESAACLPNQIILKIVAKNGYTAGADMITG